jgi:TubC N-terminal docking domain
VKAHALLEDLRSRDGRLDADGERLIVDAPAGTVTEEIRTALADLKPKLLKLLEWEQRKLSAAGWKPNERCGKTIWKRPDNGFYYSQEMAVHFLDKGIGNIGLKSGANRRR